MWEVKKSGTPQALVALLFAGLAAPQWVSEFSSSTPDNTQGHSSRITMFKLLSSKDWDILRNSFQTRDLHFLFSAISSLASLSHFAFSRPSSPSKLLSCCSLSRLLPSCSCQEAVTNILWLLGLLRRLSTTSISVLSPLQLSAQLFGSRPLELGLPAAHLCLCHLSGSPQVPKDPPQWRPQVHVFPQGRTLPLTRVLWLPQLLLLLCSHQSNSAHCHIFVLVCQSATVTAAAVSVAAAAVSLFNQLSSSNKKPRP